MARPRTHDDAVRGRLLEHASAAIARGGPDLLSVRAVAAAAGTTTAAVYSLFGGLPVGDPRPLGRPADVPRT